MAEETFGHEQDLHRAVDTMPSNEKFGNGRTHGKNHWIRYVLDSYISFQFKVLKRGTYGTNIRLQQRRSHLVEILPITLPK